MLCLPSRIEKGAEYPLLNSCYEVIHLKCLIRPPIHASARVSLRPARIELSRYDLLAKQKVIASSSRPCVSRE